MTLGEECNKCHSYQPAVTEKLEDEEDAPLLEERHGVVAVRNGRGLQHDAA
eukprot:CAMPEP_0168621614 /NCGR_PEP_ID=MMETSP0449_2-20121227/7794_1 /TAXON_ID=1082188 /ORGANISM="Strombidium rassoulzadegani, Strain ras09" /LENGTH=50 /DNA_ID=CAMNT_0008662757 /DNA_START=240 /DNA_END=392 /DNA_ORIENTATION=-